MTIQTNTQSLSSLQQAAFLPARSEDFSVVATLFEKLHRYNASLNEKFELAANWHEILQEHFFLTFQSDSAFWLLAWIRAQPVGLLLIEVHTDSPLFLYRHRVELVALYVEPDYRHTGLTQTFMQAAREWAERQGENCMQLYVTVQNDGARSFYKKNGWYPVQEIWHLDITPGTSRSSERIDPSCTQHDVVCSDVLESGHHHLALKSHQQEEPRETQTDPTQSSEMNRNNMKGKGE